MNIDLLKRGNIIKTCFDTVISHGYLPVSTKQNRICQPSVTLINVIYKMTYTHHSGIIITNVGDHFGTFLIAQNSRATTMKTISLSEVNI